jgi:hypothetical protein
MMELAIFVINLSINAQFENCQNSVVWGNRMELTRNQASPSQLDDPTTFFYLEGVCLAVNFLVLAGQHPVSRSLKQKSFALLLRLHPGEV